MITTPTAFILGAGASVPYGLPTGNELRFTLAHVASAYHHRLLDCGFSEEAIEQFRRRLAKHDDESIDQFLSNFDPSQPDHAELISIGKHAIAACILFAENHWTRLWDPERDADSHDRPSSAPQKWYTRLLNDILANSHMSDLATLHHAPIYFITFNYDRSLEQYFLDNIRSRCEAQGIKDADQAAREVVAQMRIHHIYGKAGDLPSNIHEEDGVPYGGSRKEHIQRAAEGIRVIPKDRPDPSDTPAPGGLDIALDWLDAAQRIAIIGFGFDDTNCRLLRLDDYLGDYTKAKWITTCGLRQRALNRIDNAVYKMQDALMRDHKSNTWQVDQDVKPLLVATDCSCPGVLRCE